MALLQMFDEQPNQSLRQSNPYVNNLLAAPLCKEPLKKSETASDMPEFTEFNSLFSEYKIKTFSVNLVPTLKQNVDANNITAAVPNFQVFAVPVNYTDDVQDFSLLSAADIDSFLNQTQRKSMRLMFQPVGTPGSAPGAPATSVRRVRRAAGARSGYGSELRVAGQAW